MSRVVACLHAFCEVPTKGFSCNWAPGPSIFVQNSVKTNGVGDGEWQQLWAGTVVSAGYKDTPTMCYSLQPPCLLLLHRHRTFTLCPAL